MFTPKAEFRLTSTQIRAVEPVAAKLIDSQGAVLGQCWLAPNGGKGQLNTAVFYYLTPKQFECINKAIMEAMKITD